MKNLKQTFFALFLLLAGQTINAQNVAPEGATVVDLQLTEQISEQAKKLKNLETAVLFKGVSRTEFHVYLKDGIQLKDLEKELATMFGTEVKATLYKD